MQPFNSRGQAGGFLCLVFEIPIFLLILSCGGTTATQPDPPPASPAESVEQGDSRGSLSHAGIERTYRLHIPPGYEVAHPTPLVLAFHGIGLDADEMARIGGLNEEADESGFIVVYPNGTGENQSWNGGHCCGEAAKNDVDDVGFVRALIDELGASFNIDPRRIYATGFSNGAILAYRLACELSDRIAAIGPVAATQILEDQEACRPARNVAVIHFHGTADRLNPYEGGTAASGFVFLSVEEAMRFWAEKNACLNPLEQTESGTIQHEVYAACAQDSAIEVYTIVGGQHAWPGGEAVSAQIGEPTMEISASLLMWEFFEAHPMP